MGENPKKDFNVTKLKEEFMSKYRTKQVIEENITTPKIAYSLFDYIKLEDTTVNYLTKIRFRDQYKEILCGKCPLCNQSNIRPDHILTCPLTGLIRNIRHNNVVN